MEMGGGFFLRRIGARPVSYEKTCNLVLNLLLYTHLFYNKLA